jgi:hypothetical protein
VFLNHHNSIFFTIDLRLDKSLAICTKKTDFAAVGIPNLHSLNLLHMVKTSHRLFFIIKTDRVFRLHEELQRVPTWRTRQIEEAVFVLAGRIPRF